MLWKNIIIVLTTALSAQRLSSPSRRAAVATRRLYPDCIRARFPPWKEYSSAKYRRASLDVPFVWATFYLERCLLHGNLFRALINIGHDLFHRLRFSRRGDDALFDSRDVDNLYFRFQAPMMQLHPRLGMISRYVTLSRDIENPEITRSTMEIYFTIMEIFCCISMQRQSLSKVYGIAEFLSLDTLYVRQSVGNGSIR